MLNLWNKVRALGRFLRSRTFMVSMLSLVLAFVVFQITTTTNRVYITDKNNRSINFTMESKPENILKGFGIGTLSEQEAGFAGVSGHYAEIDTTNLFKATITQGGETTEYQAERGMTVGDLLYENNIDYDGNDLLTPAADKPLEDGDEIVLQRVEYEQHTVDENIPFETVYKNSSLLNMGSRKCIQEGKDGIKTLTYTRRTVDGVKEDEHLLGEQVKLAPVTQTILLGSLEPVSKLDFDINVDENGKPVKFAKLLTNQVATGYSARKGAKTASGRYALTGHVAVDPREIPYGSRLYIVSTDNRFVYGCAIAADTGTGLLDDIVDVDLFYDTYQESVLNGRRIVDIYILE